MPTQEVLSGFKMDYTIDDFSKYKQYLNTIDSVLKKYFEEQKEYIFCKKGCAYCCQKGQYPYSELEFKYLLLGFFRIPLKEQQNVIKRIKDLKEEWQKIENKNEYKYRCPFLDENNICTVYDYRGLICRTFGLLTITPSDKCVIPFCHSLGLNYSNVYDSENKKIDFEKVEKEGYKIFPNARKTNIKTLMSPEIFENDPIEFGEIKQMIEWM